MSADCTADDCIAEPEENVLYKRLGKMTPFSNKNSEKDEKLRKLLENVKKEIKSVCISSAHNFLAIPELEEDYRILTGVDLREVSSTLEFSSVTEMLNSLDGDAINIFQDSSDVTRVKSVSSAQTKHLEELVAKQKRTGQRERLRSSPYVRLNGTSKEHECTK